MRRAILGVLVSTVLAVGMAPSLRAGVDSPAWMSAYSGAMSAGESLLNASCIKQSAKVAYDKQASDALDAISEAFPMDKAPQGPGPNLTRDQQAAHDAWFKLSALKEKVEAMPICIEGRDYSRNALRKWKPTLISQPKGKDDAGKPGSVAGQPVKPEGAQPKDVELARKAETGASKSSETVKSSESVSSSEKRVAKSPAPPASVSPSSTAPASATLCRQSPCGCGKLKPPKVCPAGSGCACTKG